MENTNTGYGPGQYGSLPENKEQKHNSSAPIAPGQKVSPPMSKLVQDGNVRESSMKPRD